MAVSPDGTSVFVNGLSSGTDPNFPFDYATVAYNATTGHKLWCRRLNGRANLSDVPYDLAISFDGARLFVTGTSDATDSGTDYLTVAYPTGR